MLGFSNPEPASRSLRVMAALLGYPRTEVREYLPEMREILRSEGALSAARQAELDALIDSLSSADPLETEANYVQLFDRGPAMIDLAQTYEKAGLYMTLDELPDYLPAVLEFVSTQPPREARAFLGEMAHIFNALFSALQQRASPYASVLGALLELAGEKAQAVKPAAEPTLDESWVEPPVFDGCSSKGQAKPGQPQPIHLVRKNAKTGAAV